MNNKLVVAILMLVTAGLIAVTYLRPLHSVEQQASSISPSKPQPEFPAPASSIALIPAH